MLRGSSTAPEFEVSDVVWHEGFLQIDETLDKTDLLETEVEKAEQKMPMGGPILEGSRNNTMSRFAGRGSEEIWCVRQGIPGIPCRDRSSAIRPWMTAN